MKKKFFVEIVALLHILLFVYASVEKITDYYNFRFGLSESPFIAPFAGILVWAVPAVESGIAAMLVIPRFRLAGLYASLFLMSLFTLYIASMLAFGQDIPCSCGGVIEEMSWSMHIIFNLLFVLLAAWAIRYERRRKRVIIVPVTATA